MRKSGALAVDVAVLGAGIAGLWTAAAAAAAGYSVLVFGLPADPAHQSVASQGIVHGGLKYGRPGGIDAALAPMPARWRQALAGEGPVDLRAAAVLSERMLLWFPPALAAEALAAGARLRLRGETRLLAGRERPAPFDAVAGGRLLELAEPVLDVPSVLSALGRGLPTPPLALDAAELETAPEGGIARLRPAGGSAVEARRWVLAAGAGNAGLLARLGRPEATQRRPLRQVLATGAPYPLFLHVARAGVAGAAYGTRLTLTSHRRPDGRLVWYMGGDVAERGSGLDERATLALARAELAALLPGAAPERLDWSSLWIERAEPRTSDGRTPAGIGVSQHGNAVAVWPTKLALAPAVADAVLAGLRADGIAPSPLAGAGLAGMASLPPPAAPWSEAGPCS